MKNSPFVRRELGAVEGATGSENKNHTWNEVTALVSHADMSSLNVEGLSNKPAMNEHKDLEVSSSTKYSVPSA